MPVIEWSVLEAAGVDVSAADYDEVSQRFRLRLPSDPMVAVSLGPDPEVVPPGVAGWRVARFRRHGRQHDQVWQELEFVVLPVGDVGGAVGLAVAWLVDPDPPVSPVLPS